jgi:hypothetical protein
MRVHFCALGCNRFQQAAWRIANEARRLGIFETVTVYDHLPEAWKEGRDVNTRGAGYWFWKPKLIREVMETKAAEGDIVVYCDTGCKLYQSSEWKSLLSTFQENPQLNCLAPILTEFKERLWCKADLFAHFGLDLASKEATDPHLSASFSFWRKSEATFELIRQWQLLLDNLHLVDDSPSKLPNHPDFREHRHDQAILSLLLKTSKIDKRLIPNPSFPQREDQAIFTYRSTAGPWD